MEAPSPRTGHRDRYRRKRLPLRAEFIRYQEYSHFGRHRGEFPRRKSPSYTALFFNILHWPFYVHFYRRLSHWNTSTARVGPETRYRSYQTAIRDLWHSITATNTSKKQSNSDCMRWICKYQQSERVCRGLYRFLCSLCWRAVISSNWYAACLKSVFHCWRESLGKFMGIVWWWWCDTRDKHIAQV